VIDTYDSLPAGKLLVELTLAIVNAASQPIRIVLVAVGMEKEENLY
jgi:hypothetical protein